MPRVKKVTARKRWVDCQTGLPIEIGQEHYTWKRYRAPRQRSKSPPRRSMLTSSESLAAIYDAEDELAFVSSVEDAEDIRALLEEAMDLCEEQAENVEQYFGETEQSGLLRDRALAIEDALTELESLIRDGDIEGIQELSIGVD